MKPMFWKIWNEFYEIINAEKVGEGEGGGGKQLSCW